MNEHWITVCYVMYDMVCYPMVLGYNNPGRSTHDIASGMEGGGGSNWDRGPYFVLGKT